MLVQTEEVARTAERFADKWGLLNTILVAIAVVAVLAVFWLYRRMNADRQIDQSAQRTSEKERTAQLLAALGERDAALLSSAHATAAAIKEAATLSAAAINRIEENHAATQREMLNQLINTLRERK